MSTAHLNAAAAHYEQAHRHGLAVTGAAAQLAADLHAAISSPNPAQFIRTPTWMRTPFTQASDVLHAELETHHVALAELVRDAAAGLDVRARAQALLEAACASHADNHAETVAEAA